MAVVEKSVIMERIKNLIGDNTDDNALSLIEDVSDTIDDFANKATNTDASEWEKKYNENDAMWRKRYTDRFFNGSDGTSDAGTHKDVKGDEVEDQEKKYTYDELFKSGEENNNGK